MKSYTIKRIATLLGISEEQAKKARAIVRGEYTVAQLLDEFPEMEKWYRQCGNAPRVHEVRLSALNETIGGFGVEGLPLCEGVMRHDEYADYINMGDTYTNTIIRHAGRYYIGTWGDLAEKCGAEKRQ